MIYSTDADVLYSTNEIVEYVGGGFDILYSTNNPVEYSTDENVKYVISLSANSYVNIQLEDISLTASLKNPLNADSINVLNNTLLQGEIKVRSKINSSVTLQPVAINSEFENDALLNNNTVLENVSLDSIIDPELLEGFNTSLQLGNVVLNSIIESFVVIDSSTISNNVLLLSEIKNHSFLSSDNQLQGAISGFDIESIDLLNSSTQLTGTLIDCEIGLEIQIESLVIQLDDTVFSGEFNLDENFKSSSQLQSTGLQFTMQRGVVINSSSVLENVSLYSIIGESYPSFYIEPDESSSDEIEGDGTIFRVVQSGKVVRTTEYKEVYKFKVIHDGMELDEVQELDEFYERNKSVKFVFNWPLDRSGQIVPYEVNFVKPQRVVDYYPLQRKMEVNFIGQRLV